MQWNKNIKTEMKEIKNKREIKKHEAQSRKVYAKTNEIDKFLSRLIRKIRARIKMTGIRN